MQDRNRFTIISILIFGGLLALFISSFVSSGLDDGFMNENFASVKRFDDQMTVRLPASNQRELIAEKNDISVKRQEIVPPQNIDQVVEAQNFEEETGDKEIVLYSIFNLQKYDKVIENFDESGRVINTNSKIILRNGKIESLIAYLPSTNKSEDGTVEDGQMIELSDVEELNDGISVKYSVDGENYFIGVINKSNDEVAFTFSLTGPFSGTRLVFRNIDINSNSEEQNVETNEENNEDEYLKQNQTYEIEDRLKLEEEAKSEEVKTVPRNKFNFSQQNQNNDESEELDEETKPQDSEETLEADS